MDPANLFQASFGNMHKVVGQYKECNVADGVNQDESLKKSLPMFLSACLTAGGRFSRWNCMLLGLQEAP
jgi:hypothetical protein